MGLTSSALTKRAKTSNPRLDWKMLDALGAGTYGKVYRVEHKQSGDVAAAKVAELERKDQLYDFKEEMSILESRRHMNLTSLVECYWYNNKELWIVLELCEGGSLNDVCKRLDRQFTEDEVADINYQSLTGLAFLHDNLVIHRDINASNIMLSASGLVKIGDFGVAAILKSDRERRNTFIGSPNWLAPEVVRCENDKSCSYDFKVDVWSLGAACMEMLEGKPPYSDLNPVKVVMKLATSAKPPSLQNPDAFSEAFQLFLARAMTVDPVKRPTSLELAQDDFCRDRPSRHQLAALLQ
eukprot:m.230705 g.230705  ORF g.230705 m.230705 type:complete len:296 (+) comp17354_c0_seq7:3654-4541(+)